MKKILVTGTIAFDHLFSYEDVFLEKLREATAAEVLSASFQAKNYVRRYGGTGANIAWNMALLGGKPLLVGCVGMDGDEYVDVLQKRGVDTSLLQREDSVMSSTGVCCTDTRGHQMWFFYQGADALGRWPDVTAVRDTIEYAIIGARHNPRMLEGLRRCKEDGIPAIFDPGHYIMDFTPDELKEAIHMSTGVIVNAFEWSILGKRVGLSAEEVAKQLEYLIITHGEEGHTIHTKDGSQSFPRCNCDNPVNPAGAGDAFRAGLLLGITSGWTLEQASKLGAATASFVVEQEGTLLDTLDREKLAERINTAYGDALPALPA